ncbi:helix-turn-helix transcriptional regulator [Kitasatospora sp. NPDC058201]|uniref:helix-turn-helix transcriptional regulator n=1 Tax=unclassified Kitasatospora TaxID=2633591 RepID=UPI00365DE91A
MSPNAVNDLSAIATGDLRGLLTSCRERTELSQEKVAEMIGVSGRHYGDFERGNVHRPSRLLLDRVAKVLKMSEAEERSMNEIVLDGPGV